MAITIFSPWEVVLWTPWHYLGELVSTDVNRVASLDASAFCVAAAEERHGKDGVFQWKNYRKTHGKTMEKPWDGPLGWCYVGGYNWGSLWWILLPIRRKTKKKVKKQSVFAGYLHILLFDRDFRRS